MKLSAFKELVQSVDELKIALPNGDFVPKHFHVTEVGCITKNFIDCGGTVREEKVKLDLSNLVASSNSCTPGSGCC